MQRTQIALFLVLAAIVCGLTSTGRSPHPAVAGPSQMVDFPDDCREENWGRSGSCAYAALDSMFRLHGLESEARHVRETCHGGASLPELYTVSVDLCVATIWTNKRDERFLERACLYQKGCVVGLWAGGKCVPYVHPRICPKCGHSHAGHAVVLFHFDRKLAGLYDSNHCEGPIRWVTRAQFLHDWMGWAITPAR